MKALGNTTVIIAGTVVATGLTTINQLISERQTESLMRPIIGGFVVGTVLLTIAFFNTSVAAALALLLLVTSVLTNGVAILQKVMRMTS